MSAEARVGLDVDDGIARLRLTRGEAGNAIDPAWVRDFGEAVAAVADDASVRVLLVSADGPVFTVGGDLRHFSARVDDLDAALEEMVPPFHVALAQLAAVAPPVVCAVNGAIAGGGLGIAWASDIVIADDDARFATGFHKLGLSGDGGSSWYLPRLVGLRRAQQMLLGGRVLDAAEALEWGLVTEVVAPGELTARAEQVAAELAAGPPGALAKVRRLVRESTDLTLEEHFARENAGMIECGRTADAAEGVRAFVERRTPEFRGE